MISKRFACKKFNNIFLTYTIHVEASLMRWLGEFQIAQIESLVLKLSKFVKICRTCLLLRLLEREVIHRVYLPFLRMTVWSSAIMISVRLTIVSCVIRDIREDMWFFSFFLSNEFAELQIHNLTAGDYALLLRSAIDCFRWPFERFLWCSQSTTVSLSPPPPSPSAFLKFHLIGRWFCLFYIFLYIVDFVFLTTSVCILELLMEPLEGSVVTKEN